MKDLWTIRKVLDWTKSYLSEKGVENARLETEWLLAAALQVDRVGIYLNFDKPLTENELSLIRGMVSRRGRREPLQYILGSEEFDGHHFLIDSTVLIPRHDTETLLAEAVKRMSGNEKVLDLCTGSGCLAISIKKRFPDAIVTGSDISESAMETAVKNALRLEASVEFVASDLFKAFSNRRFDIIVSNPPYIPSEEIETLQPEVSIYEPRTALDGGKDGLDFYRRISEKACEHLEPEGWLLVETGAGEAADVTALFERAGLTSIFTAADDAGIERVAGGQKRP